VLIISYSTLFNGILCLSLGFIIYSMKNNENKQCESCKRLKGDIQELYDQMNYNGRNHRNHDDVTENWERFNNKNFNRTLKCTKCKELSKDFRTLSRAMRNDKSDWLDVFGYIGIKIGKYDNN